MASSTIKFALNHKSCPTLSPIAALNVAKTLGISGLELRNDVGENSIATIEQAQQIGEHAAKLGIDILTINALYPFNVWHSEQEQNTVKLAQLAQACGAQALVCCPLVAAPDEQNVPGQAELISALKAIAPILSEHNIKGMVEPLGFPSSSLRFKEDAVAAIDAAGLGDIFSLVHDTFHHAGSDDQSYYPNRTGLIHASAVTDSDVSMESMLDGHRYFVGPGDRLNSITQIKHMLSAGYAGYVSFEPFAEDIATYPNPTAAIKESMEYVLAELDASTAE